MPGSKGHALLGLILCLLSGGEWAEGRQVVTSHQMVEIGLEARFKDALNREGYCDVDLAEILRVLEEIHIRRRQHQQRSVFLYRDILSIQEGLVDAARREAEKTGGTLGATVAGEIFNVGVAAMLDAVDAIGDFMSRKYSELGGTATVARGSLRNLNVARATKASGRSTSLAMGIDKAFDGLSGSAASSPLILRVKRKLTEVTEVLEAIRSLDELEKRLWDVFFGSPLIEDELRGYCAGSWARVSGFVRKGGLADRLGAARHAAENLIFNSIYNVLAVNEEEAVVRRFGLSALGPEWGFSSARDDPLSIRNFVVPELKRMAPLALELEMLDQALDSFTARANPACSLCEGFRNLKALFDIYLLIRVEEGKVKRRLLENLGKMRETYEKVHLALNADDVQRAFAHPAYIAAATGVSFIIPWSGSVIAGGEAAYNVYRRWYASFEEGPLRQELKKLNFYQTLYQDFYGRLRSIYKEWEAKVREQLALLQKCEIPRCDEESLRLSVGEPHTLIVEVLKEMELGKLEGCWAFTAPMGMVLSPAVYGGAPSPRTFQLRIRRKGKGVEATWRFPHGAEIPLRYRYGGDHIEFHHRFTARTYRLYRPGADRESVSRALADGSEYVVKVRPYESRRGVIEAMAVQFGERSRRGGQLLVGGWLSRPAIDGIPKLEVRDARGVKVQTIGNGDAIVLRARIGDPGCGMGRREVFVRLAPAKEITAGRWVRLVETSAGSGVFESLPLTVDFFTRGGNVEEVYVLPSLVVTMIEFSLVPQGTIRFRIRDAGEIKPIDPGTDEAFRYGAASFLSPDRERIEVLEYLTLDPFTRPSVSVPAMKIPGMAIPGMKIPGMNIPQVNLPGRGAASGTTMGGAQSVPAPAALGAIPVRVPPRAKVSGGAGKYERAYREIEARSKQPDWADYRVRQLYLMKRYRADLVRTVNRMRRALAAPPAAVGATAAGLIQKNVDHAMMAGFLSRLEETKRDFDRRIGELQRQLQREPVVTVEKRKERENELADLKRKIAMLKEARKEYKEIAMAWMRMGDLIDKQRDEGRDVSDLMENLRRISEEVNEKRDRYVELERKWGNLRDLEARLESLSE